MKMENERIYETVTSFTELIQGTDIRIDFMTVREILEEIYQ